MREGIGAVPDGGGWKVGGVMREDGLRKAKVSDRRAGQVRRSRQFMCTK